MPLDASFALPHIGWPAHHPHPIRTLPTSWPPDPVQVLTGDWRNVLGDLERIESVQPGEVRDAAGRWLRPDNRFTGYVLPA